MEVMKRGAVKYAGSPFAALKPEEREMWQELVDHSFAQFKEIVEQGRPQLKGKLEEKVIDEKRVVTDNDGKNPMPIQYVRRLADGGIFTADLAEKHKLVDKIGYQDDAVKEAHDLAGLGSDYEVIKYEKPFSLLESFLGANARAAKEESQLSQVLEGFTPRLWYLAPGFDVAGIISGRQK
jgi:protease-4